MNRVHTYQTPIPLHHLQQRPKFHRQGRRRQKFTVQNLRIDRRQHLELAWERQRKEEERLRRELSERSQTGVVEIKNLNQLDTVLEKAGSSLVVVFFYSRSCGSCKEVRKNFEKMSREYRSQTASLIFVKHDVRDEFDFPSDVKRMYKIRAVPSFAFFAGGAMVTRISMRDTRELRGSSDRIQAEMLSDQKRLSDTLRRMLFRIAPSAMR